MSTVQSITAERRSSTGTISQPHPNDPTLASTLPHHKHVPPDIKHHRIPAPGLSFTKPNLPFLIEEIQAMLDRVNSDTEAT